MEIPPELLAAQQALLPLVMSLDGVAGVDIGLTDDGGLALRVIVRSLEAIPFGIPDEILEIPVTIVERDIQIEADLSRFDPLVGGISIGHLSALNTMSSGTMGGIARENNTGELRGVSNEHVVGAVGNAIYQPEFFFLPPPSGDMVGNVMKASFPTAPNPLPPFKPIGMVDAACFSVNRAAEASIAEIGAVRTTAVASIGDKVQKRGKTTGLTFGTVTAIGFYENRGSVLVNQFEVTVDSARSAKWSDSGDSGSLVIKEDTGEIVGLHWGGNAGGFGIASDIETVEAELGLSFSWPIPQVDTVSPSQCLSAGGELVDIEGVGFQLATEVLFGGVPAQSFSVTDDRHISAVTPPNNGNAVVTVSAPGGTSDAQFGASVDFL